MKLSIVLPCYNVAQYIDRCLLSCINQNIDESEYEIIAVDDGSTDDTGAIIDDYANKYNIVKAYHKKNGGLPDARNYGMKYATGDYLWLIDSDDFIKENILKDVFELIDQTNADVVWEHYQFYYDENNKQAVEFTKDFTEAPITGRYFLENVHNRFYSAWTFIFKRSLWTDNNLSFDPNRKLFEDLDVIPFVLAKGERVINYPFVIYNYVQRSGSLLNNIKPDFYVYHIKRILKKYNQASNSDPVFNKLYFANIRLFLGYLRRREFAPYKKECITFFKENKIDALYESDGSMSHKMANLMFKYTPTLFISLLSVIGKYFIK